MKTRGDQAGIAATALIAVAAIVAAALGLSRSTDASGARPTFDYDPVDYPPGSAVVVAKQAAPASAILGIRWRSPESTVDVAFVVSMACVGGIGDDATWPLAADGCGGFGSFTGPITGLGRTDDGNGLVVVRLETTAECAAAVEPGMIWPSDGSRCPSSS